MKVIESLYKCCQSGNETAVKTILERENLDDLCYKIIVSYYDAIAGDNDIKRIVDVLNYLEEELSIASTVSDTVYDMALETLNDANETVVGIDTEMGEDVNVREHQYPELRGSLKKVHYPTESNITFWGEPRKSLENYLCASMESFINDNPEDPVNIVADYKWDGASNIFECSKNKIKHVLTRYKVEKNLGKDITHIYEGLTVEDIFWDNIPPQVYELESYGIKTEVIMTKTAFEEYKKYIMDNKCNRRSAVSSILNRTADNLDPKMLNFLKVIPLQISTATPLKGDPTTVSCGNTSWAKAGIINGRYQYIGFHHYHGFAYPMFLVDKQTLTKKYSSPYFAELANELYCSIRPLVEENALNEEVPIDGMVFTLLNQKLIEQLGRSNDKNNFQVAFKFPAGTEKTTLLDVEFQVGPIAGTITPVAIVKPVFINGSRITHIGLSNLEKLEKLDLHKGDEIIVQYDIIPKIIVDKTCKKSGGEPIEIITTCPVCGGKIKSGRCINVDCDAKLAGKIINYVNKMNIPKFGVETISTLVSRGILTSIIDLYKLSGRRSELLKIPGFKEKTVDSLIAAPLNKVDIYPHEMLGSIGIPDISLTIMEKVCRVIDLDVLVNTPEIVLTAGVAINGVGDKTAFKIMTGILQKSDLIKGIMPYFTFKPYKNSVGNVVFTGIRDPEFASFLKDNPGIATSNSVTKDTIAVITKDKPNIETGSMKDAKQQEIPIIAITEAKHKWGYNP